MHAREIHVTSSYSARAELQPRSSLRIRADWTTIETIGPAGTALRRGARRRVVRRARGGGELSRPHAPRQFQCLTIPVVHAQLARAADGRAPQRLSLFDRRANSEPPPRRDRDAVDPLGELTREDTRLFELPKTIGRLYDDFLNRPGQRLLLGALALLLGHYLAGSLSTIFGAAGFWEPISALLPALVCERISREYYMRGSRERSTTLELCAAAHACHSPHTARSDHIAACCTFWQTKRPQGGLSLRRRLGCAQARGVRARCSFL